MRPAFLCSIALVAACSRGGAATTTTAATQPAPPADAPAGSCAADELGPLDRSTLYVRCHDIEGQCRAACDRDDVASCFGLAMLLEEREMELPEREASADSAQSNVLYRKACLLGAANACTNHAAQLWASSSSDADIACAQRLFEASCDHDDHFGCGMAGRLLIDGATGPDDEDVSRGRAILERSCIQIGGFPCRILALNLERGKLGAVPEGRIAELMQMACDGGDLAACGEHASVEESFGR